MAESSGLFVDRLDQIRADVDAHSSEWMPRERVEATLTSKWVPPHKDPAGSSTLTIIWFQDEGTDPFERLAEIVRTLDWAALAAYEPEED